MNKDMFIKILLPALVITSLFITIIPEIRQIGIIFFIVGSIAWYIILIGKFEILTHNDETDRMLKYFLYPLIIINILLLIFSESYRNAGVGWVYLILSILTLLMYMTPQFKSIVIGVDKRITKGIFAGIGVAIGFFIISKIAPGFSLLVPELPFSILSGVRGIILIGIAPVMEATAWRCGLLPYLQKVYGLSFTTANSIQSFIFGFFHLLAYGVIAGSLETLTELFGATQAIFGSLLIAIIFAFIMGILVRKFNNLMVEYIPHAIINGILFFTVLSVGSFFSLG